MLHHIMQSQRRAQMSVPSNWNFTSFPLMGENGELLLWQICWQYCVHPTSLPCRFTNHSFIYKSANWVCFTVTATLQVCGKFLYSGIDHRKINHCVQSKVSQLTVTNSRMVKSYSVACGVCGCTRWRPCPDTSWLDWRLKDLIGFCSEGQSSSGHFQCCRKCLLFSISNYYC